MKFVSMENGDPEIDQSTADLNDQGDVVVELSATCYRNCAECSNQLKSLCVDVQEEKPLSEWLDQEGKALTEAKVAEIMAAHKAGKVSIECEAEAEVDESGGGRYQKNMITTTFTVNVTLNIGEEKLEIHSDFSSENAAGEFEECC